MNAAQFSNKEKVLMVDSQKRTNVQMEGSRVVDLLAKLCEYIKDLHNSSLKEMNRSYFFPLSQLDELFLVKMIAGTKNSPTLSSLTIQHHKGILAVD
jgi:hypothetical protein